MSYEFEIPTREDYLRESSIANSPRRRQVIKKAHELQRARAAQYRKGLLTPNDYAKACVDIWLDAEEMTSKD